jgi:hypothetical protein
MRNHLHRRDHVAFLHALAMKEGEDLDRLYLVEPGEGVVTHVHDPIPLRHQLQEALPRGTLVHPGTADRERELFAGLILMHVVRVGPHQSQLGRQPALRRGRNEGLGERSIDAGALREALSLDQERRDEYRAGELRRLGARDFVRHQAARAHRAAKSSQNCSVSFRAVPSSR